MDDVTMTLDASLLVSQGRDSGYIRFAGGELRMAEGTPGTFEVPDGFIERLLERASSLPIAPLDPPDA